MLAVLLLATVPALAADDNDAFRKASQLGWVDGPTTITLADVADVKLPKGPRFLGQVDTSKFLALNGNPPADNKYTIASKDMRWFAILDYTGDGKVADDDKIDPDAMLKAFRENESSSNAERKSAGLEELTIDGWFVPPHYDAASHNLEWGTRLHGSSGTAVVNYTSRILGRGGYMRTILVSDPEHFAADLAEFRTVMKGYDYKSGQHYAEWRNGDKLAGYGLAALITGGAAAAAVKTGFFKTLLVGLAAGWKFIAVGVVAAFATLKRFFGRLFKRGDDS